MPRKTRQVETRALAEYLLKNYSSFPTISKQPLGKIPYDLVESEGIKRAMGLMRPYRPEVDGIVILPRYLLLIEFKVKAVIDGLAKLPMYKSLVPYTPELKDYQDREILMQLVVGWTNPNLEIMAHSAGVSVKVYCPLWLSHHVDEYHKYWTAEYRQARDEKLKMRELLGLE